MISKNCIWNFLKKRWHICYACLLLYMLIRFSFRTVVNRHSRNQEILKLYENLVLNLNENAEFDNSGMYKTLFLRKPDNHTSFDITIVTQCSFNHLNDLNNLLKNWTGPISAAVYTEGEFIEKTLWNIAKLIICHRDRDLRLQIVVPSNVAFKENLKFTQDTMKNSVELSMCDKYEVPLEYDRQNYNWTSLYPINLLRNVAKKSSSTYYIFVIDIDMTPSRNFRFNFLKFAYKMRYSSFKEVYVVPVFEIRPEAPVPSNKEQLKRYYFYNVARQFYLLPCKKCHELTNYKNWFFSEYTPYPKVLYQVDWVHPWEPFFIARHTIPNYDERFKQYGMNRVSQICELHVAGYNFLVIDNIFLLHKGFKSLKGFHATKEKEMEKNRRLYNRFKTDVKLKYLNSTRTCVKLMEN